MNPNSEDAINFCENITDDNDNTNCLYNADDGDSLRYIYTY
jgi:hypothetical protein